MQQSVDQDNACYVICKLTAFISVCAQEAPYLPHVSDYVKFLKDFETVESAASSMAKSATPKASAKPKARGKAKAKAAP